MLPKKAGEDIARAKKQGGHGHLRRQNAYQCSGTESSKISNSLLSQDLPKYPVNTFANRQYHSPSLPEKDGGTKSQALIDLSKEI